MYVAEDEDDADDGHTQLKLSTLGKRSACSSKDVFDIDANRSRTRSGAKHLFNELAQGAVNILKEYTSTRKSTAHDHAHEAVSSTTKNKYFIMGENEKGQITKFRPIAQDSQSYNEVNTIMNDGNQVTFESQEEE